MSTATSSPAEKNPRTGGTWGPRPGSLIARKCRFLTTVLSQPTWHPASHVRTAEHKKLSSRLPMAPSPSPVDSRSARTERMGGVGEATEWAESRGLEVRAQDRLGWLPGAWGFHHTAASNCVTFGK